MVLRIPASVKEYAREDIDEVISEVNSRTEELNCKLVRLTFRSEGSSNEDMSVYCDATIRFDSGFHVRECKFTYEYVINGDDVYSGGDIRELVESLEHKLMNHIDCKVVDAATGTGTRKRIVAADGDEDFDMEATPGEIIEDDDSDFDDSLDDLSDQVEDIQDQVEEIDEDEVDIELDNNIDGHYVAECDACHGIFISAMIESDQQVDKISGVCPLCEKESDQYLKWVVKAVEKK